MQLLDGDVNNPYELTLGVLQPTLHLELLILVQTMAVKILSTEYTTCSTHQSDLARYFTFRLHLHYLWLMKYNRLLMKFSPYHKLLQEVNDIL